MRLSPAATWVRHDDDLYVHGEDRVLRLQGFGPEADELMAMLEHGCTRGAIDDVLMSTHDADDMLAALTQAGFLTTTSSSAWIGTPLERQADYFSALATDPDQAHAAFGDVTIAILGVGGLGSVALTHLLAAGVQKFILIDGDTVEARNLNRQWLYTASDIGRPKAEAAMDQVRQRSTSATVVAVPRTVTSADQLAAVLADSATLLILAADTPHDITLWAAQACKHTNTAMISAGCGLRTASWGPLIPHEALRGYIEQLRARRDRAVLPPAAHPMRASFGPTNSIVASYLAKDVLHWLAGMPVPSEGATVTIDMEALTARKVSLFVDDPAEVRPDRMQRDL